MPGSSFQARYADPEFSEAKATADSVALPAAPGHLLASATDSTGAVWCGWPTHIRCHVLRSAHVQLGIGSDPCSGIRCPG